MGEVAFSCESTRARGVDQGLWTYDRSACGYNHVTWALFFTYG
ncbi:hypothetical protein [Streptomyces sp. SID3343]|nr:hypothetical protein [Streptomyces sp. SID3343]